MTDFLDRIVTDAAPEPAGHYVHATVWRDLVFASGQLGVRLDGSHTSDEDFRTQATQAMNNLLAVLKASGCGPEHILRVTGYIVGVENWSTFNEVYAGLMEDSKPARTVVPVPELHHGYLVEVEAIAVRS